MTSGSLLSQNANYPQSPSRRPHLLTARSPLYVHSDVEVQGLVAHVDLFRVDPESNSITPDSANETANLTKHTFGSSFVHATHILDLTGQPAIIFVFAVSVLVVPPSPDSVRHPHTASLSRSHLLLQTAAPVACRRSGGLRLWPHLPPLILWRAQAFCSARPSIGPCAAAISAPRVAPKVSPDFILRRATRLSLI